MMKKILFISGLQISPPESGGQLRSFNLCANLARQGHQVQVYSFTGRKADYLERVSSSNNRVEDNFHEYINRNSFFGIVQFLFYKLKLPPLWLGWVIRLFLPDQLKDYITWADTIVLDFPFLYPIAGRTTKKVILNTHNAEFDLYHDRPWLLNLVKKTELKAFKNVHEVIFCTDKDRETFSKDLPRLVDSPVIPNGIDVKHYLRNEDIRQEVRSHLGIKQDTKVILFTGSHYRPNKNAFDYLQSFAKESRQILEQYNILFLVVGSVSHQDQSIERFISMGRVSEITPFFHAADLAINPVVEGSGANVKMMEYIAAKLPILSTEFGARGMQLEDGQECFFFEKNQLVTTLRKALSETSQEQLTSMATNAYTRNEYIIDMSKAMEHTAALW